jgi:hypothetical protein
MMNYFTGVFVVPSQGRKIKLNSFWKNFCGYDHFTDDKFREQFRVSQVGFLQLYEVIKHNPIFSSVKKRRSLYIQNLGSNEDEIYGSNLW